MRAAGHLQQRKAARVIAVQQTHGSGAKAAAGLMQRCNHGSTAPRALFVPLQTSRATLTCSSPTQHCGQQELSTRSAEYLWSSLSMLLIPSTGHWWCGCLESQQSGTTKSPMAVCCTKRQCQPDVVKQAVTYRIHFCNSIAPFHLFYSCCSKRHDPRHRST